MTAEKTTVSRMPPPRRLRTANARQGAPARPHTSYEVCLPAYPYGAGGGAGRPRVQNGKGPARQTVYRPYEPAGRAGTRPTRAARPDSRTRQKSRDGQQAAYLRQAAQRRAALRARRARRRLAALLMLVCLFTGLLALRGLAPGSAEAMAGPANMPPPSAAAEPPDVAGSSAVPEPPDVTEPLAVTGASVAAEPPAAPEAAVAACLYALMDRYPQNCYWNHAGPDLNGYGVTEVPCPSHNSYDTCNSYVYNGDTSYQCKGFAKTIFKEIFGQECDDLPRNYDIENVTVGDYVRFGGEYAGHSFIVLERNGDEVTVLECNIGGRCIIQWGRVQSLSGALNYASEASPKYVYFSYSVHASNYSEIGMPAGSTMPENPS